MCVRNIYGGVVRDLSLFAMGMGTALFSYIRFQLCYIGVLRHEEEAHRKYVSSMRRS